MFAAGYFFWRRLCLSSTENPCSSFCPGDLEGLLHRPHWVSRGHRGTQVDCFHIPQGKLHNKDEHCPCRLLMIRPKDALTDEICKTFKRNLAWDSAESNNPWVRLARIKVTLNKCRFLPELSCQRPCWEINENFRISQSQNVHIMNPPPRAHSPASWQVLLNPSSRSSVSLLITKPGWEYNTNWSTSDMRWFKMLLWALGTWCAVTSLHSRRSTAPDLLSVYVRSHRFCSDSRSILMVTKGR